MQHSFCCMIYSVAHHSSYSTEEGFNIAAIMAQHLTSSSLIFRMLCSVLSVFNETIFCLSVFMREGYLDVKSARMHVHILKKKKALCIPAYCMLHLLRGLEAVCVGQA